MGTVGSSGVKVNIAAARCYHFVSSYFSGPAFCFLCTFNITHPAVGGHSSLILIRLNIQDDLQARMRSNGRLYICTAGPEVKNVS